MKAQGREQGTAAQLLESMAQATKRGHYTAADAYPYLAGQSGPRLADHPGLGAGRRPPGDVEAIRRSGDARAHRQGSRRGDGRAIRRPARRVSAAHAAGTDRGDEGDECGRRRDDRAYSRAGRRSGRDPPFRRRRRPDQDPAGPVDVDGVRLRRIDGDARASAVLRIVSAPARPLRARAEDHVVGAGDQEVVVAAGVDDRHERSRA